MLIYKLNKAQHGKNKICLKTAARSLLFIVCFAGQQASAVIEKLKISQIANGANHTVALKTDGTLWAWGYNGIGQLGDGTTVDKFAPVQIGTHKKWISIAAGAYHTIALKADGTLWAWGNNDAGQLGDATTANKSKPIRVGTDNKWISIAAGVRHTIALKSDGTLWAWGSNNGQR
ncbi:MAG: hypothetical protein Q7R35_07555 [Elusimicrobiota bacterium]|nr:hypothetical protein [Elusimicrobiota bacterium]